MWVEYWRDTDDYYVVLNQTEREVLLFWLKDAEQKSLITPQPILDLIKKLDTPDDTPPDDTP